MTSESEICKFYDHQDYVRTGAVSSDNPNLFLTGSYDHTVRVWDVRANTCVMTMEHDRPVECVSFFPNDGLIASTGIHSLNAHGLPQLTGQQRPIKSPFGM